MIRTEKENYFVQCIKYSDEKIIREMYSPFISEEMLNYFLSQKRVLHIGIVTSGKYKYNDSWNKLCLMAIYYPNLLESDDTFMSIGEASYAKYYSYKDDLDFIKKCYQMEPPMHVFEYLSEKLRDDMDIAILAMKSSNLASRNFNYCSERLKNIKKFVKIAINGYPRNFQYVSESLRNDVDVVDYAFKKDQRTLKYVGDEFKKTKEYIDYMKLAIENPRFDYPGEKLVASFKGNDFCDRKTMLLFTVKYDDRLIYYAKDLLRDEDFMLTAALVNPKAFPIYTHDLKNNKAFIKKLIGGIIKLNPKIYLGDILKNMSIELKEDKLFMLDLQTANPFLSTYKPFMVLLDKAK